MTLRRSSRRRGCASTVRLRGPLALLASLLVALASFLGGAPSLPAATTSQVASQRLSAREVGYTSWDFEASPDYYRVVGAAVVDVDVAAGTVRYEGLDDLGRTGRAVANVTYDMMESGSARERKDISSLRPSGWGHNDEVTIKTPGARDYHGALYNRSHLVAKSLGGSDVQENLVCGTRTQNVGDNQGQDGGMAYTEGLARTWLRAHPGGTVFYSAMPVYEGTELLCRSVIVDVRSSDGDLDLEVEVYNAALGFDVDYATGEFRAS